MLTIILWCVEMSTNQFLFNYTKGLSIQSKQRDYAFNSLLNHFEIKKDTAYSWYLKFCTFFLAISLFRVGGEGIYFLQIPTGYHPQPNMKSEEVGSSLGEYSYYVYNHGISKELSSLEERSSHLSWKENCMTWFYSNQLRRSLKPQSTWESLSKEYSVIFGEKDEYCISTYIFFQNYSHNEYWKLHMLQYLISEHFLIHTMNKPIL